jgi:two-component system, LytTR family, sensor kinase
MSQHAEPAERSSHVVALLIVLGAWLVFGVLATAQMHLFTALEGETPSIGLSILRQLPNWLVWVVLTPFVLWMARRYPVTGPPRKLIKALAVHAVAALAVAWVHSLMSLALFRVFFPTDLANEPYFRTSLAMLANRLHYWMITYACIVGLDTGIRYYRRYRDGEIASARLRAQLTQAQLDALSARLRPHFLFNALQAISTLVRDDPGRAQRMITDLGELLRATLSTSDSQYIPLSDEVILLQRYLAIEQVRFHDRLEVSIEVDPRVEQSRVPQLILQPLVENAVKHGVARQTGPARISVTARPTDRGAIELTVENGSANGAPTGQWREGIGLHTTRERLAKLYGLPPRQSLTIDSEDGRVRVTLVLPGTPPTSEEPA